MRSGILNDGLHAAYFSFQGSYILAIRNMMIFHAGSHFTNDSCAGNIVM